MGGASACRQCGGGSRLLLLSSCGWHDAGRAAWCGRRGLDTWPRLGWATWRRQPRLRWLAQCGVGNMARMDSPSFGKQRGVGGPDSGEQRAQTVGPSSGATPHLPVQLPPAASPVPAPPLLPSWLPTLPPPDALLVSSPHRLFLTQSRVKVLSPIPFSHWATRGGTVEPHSFTVFKYICANCRECQVALGTIFYVFKNTLRVSNKAFGKYSPSARGLTLAKPPSPSPYFPSGRRRVQHSANTLLSVFGLCRHSGSSIFPVVHVVYYGTLTC
jgi:hypothetical protein